MSSLSFLLALGGTFGAIVMIGIAASGVRANRRRAVQMLQAQVPELTDARQIDMARPFSERAVLPFVGALGDFAKRITPIGMRERIARQLVLSGSPQGMDANKAAAMKVFGGLGGAARGFALALLAGITQPVASVAAGFMGLFGYL